MLDPNRTIPERDDAISFNELSEQGWREFMAEFREKVWPMFKEHGFTQAEAWFAFHLNTLTGRLDDIIKLLEDDHGDCPR